MTTNEKLLAYYRSLDLREVPGGRSNAGLLAAIRRWVPWASDDSLVPWCGVLRAEAAQATDGILPAKPFRALSWLTVGRHVDCANAIAGDTVILDRGNGRGHVGLWIDRVGDDVHVLAGNTGNRISVGRHDIHDILGVRRT